MSLSFEGQLLLRMIAEWLETNHVETFEKIDGVVSCSEW
jgi:hypothetical protein